MTPSQVMSLISYLQLASQSSKYPSVSAAGTNEVWNQQKQFYQKTENLQLFYGRAGAKQTIFFKSEIKFEAER
jgi:hypothetical protein